MRTHPIVLYLCVAAGVWIPHLGFAGDPAQTPQDRAAVQKAPTMSRRLDLRPPKINDLFSQATIDRMLSASRDRDTIEEVEVEGRRTPVTPRTPAVPGGILAPFWALAHPTQAWRILAPLPPDQAATIGNTPPDATDSYRPPVLPPR